MKPITITKPAIGTPIDSIGVIASWPNFREFKNSKTKAVKVEVKLFLFQDLFEVLEEIKK